MSKPAIAAALSVFAVGCAPGALVVDEAGLLGDASRHYALGSELELSVPDGVRVESSDASVLAVRIEAGVTVAEATGEGEVLLRVLDAGDGSVLAEHVVVVEAPTSARILTGDEADATENDGIAMSGLELDVRLELEASGQALIGRGDVALVADHGLVLEGDALTHQLLVLPGTEHVVIEAILPSGEVLGQREVHVVDAE